MEAFRPKYCVLDDAVENTTEVYKVNMKLSFFNVVGRDVPVHT